MTAKTLSNGLLRTILIITTTIILVWFLIQIKTILVYIVISSILALISRPLIKLLTQRTKLKIGIAAALAMGVYVALILLFTSAFTPLINKQSKNIALLNSENFKNKVEMIGSEINLFLLDKNINIQDKLKNIDFLSNLKDIPNVINVILGSLGSLGMGLFSVLFITYFLMLDAKILTKSIYSLIPKKHVFQTARSLDSIKNLLTRYFIGLLFQIAVLFIIYTILLLSFKIDNAIIIAFLCALFNLIPYIGPLIGAVVMFILAATNNLNLDFSTQILPKTLYVMLGYFIAQMLDNFVSQPLIFSKSVKSHPLEIFLVILIFGNLFGVIGMVVCIPCYTVLKVIAKEFFSKYAAVQLLTKDL